MAAMPETKSDNSRIVTEYRSIALRNSTSSMTISTNSPPAGAGPITRSVTVPLSNNVPNASKISRNSDMLRMSMS